MAICTVRAGFAAGYRGRVLPERRRCRDGYHLVDFGGHFPQLVGQIAMVGFCLPGLVFLMNE